MDVQDGAAAMDAWAQLVDPGTDSDERERIADALLAYCALDTFAMVEIFRTLKKLI